MPRTTSPCVLCSHSSEQWEVQVQIPAVPEELSPHVSQLGAHILLHRALRVEKGAIRLGTGGRVAWVGCGKKQNGISTAVPKSLHPG